MRFLGTVALLKLVHRVALDREEVTSFVIGVLRVLLDLGLVKLHLQLNLEDVPVPRPDQ